MMGPSSAGGIKRQQPASMGAIKRSADQRGSLGVPAAAAPSLNEGAQGVPATRTAVGVEASFTTTTVTLPVSAKPTTVTVSISAASALVQVSTAGSRVSAGVVMASNPPLVLDVSGLPPGTSVAVQTQASAAAVVGITANYTD